MPTRRRRARGYMEQLPSGSYRGRGVPGHAVGRGDRRRGAVDRRDACANALEHATRLGVTGPAKRCGKSRLPEIIKETAYKTPPSVNASPAALYRSIDSEEPPTIL